MSQVYAELSGENFEKVFKTMWFYTQKFRKKFNFSNLKYKMMYSKKEL